jgi:dihydrofolate reductase
MVASLDFFIASKDGSMSWLESSDSYEKGVTGEDPEEFLRSIDCYVMGSRTYEQALVLGWPYGDVRTVVLTHRELQIDRKSVECYSGDLKRLVNERLRPHCRNIWVVGGAMVAKEFIRLKLADDLRVAIMPVLLGGGTLFVDHIGHAQALHLKDVTAYKDGIVELWYEFRQPDPASE